MVVISNFAPPTEGIQHRQPSTYVNINGKDLGKGTIYIAESRLSWVDNSSGKGFSIEYPHVSLHAVSRDLQAFPQECLYVMLDSAIEIEESKPDGEGDDLDITEVRFVPEDKGALDEMYRAMSHCQSLHPDQEGSSEEYSYESGNENLDEDFVDESDDEYFDDYAIQGAEVEGQFDDAEGEPEN